MYDNSLFFKYLPRIKEHYEYLTPLMFERSEKHPSRWVSPYCSINWPLLFSPIEMQTWMAIRGFGKTPMYPQYPVDRFFLDFGNPVVKVGIECDGKLYHTDKEKDRARDEQLEKLGWTIYRISGADCFKVEHEYGQEYELIEKPKGYIINDYYSNTIEGLIKSIAIFHFNYKPFGNEIDEVSIAARCLRDRAANNWDYVDELTMKDIKLPFSKNCFDFNV